MMVFHGNTLRVNTHLILSWFNVQSRRLLVMSKPMCPATDTEASIRIQVIRKKNRLPKVGSVLIEPMKVLKMFCWKHGVRNAFAKFWEGGEANKVGIMGDVQPRTQACSRYPSDQRRLGIPDKLGRWRQPWRHIRNRRGRLGTRLGDVQI